ISAWRVLAAGDRIGALMFNDSEIVEVRPRRSRRTVLHLLDIIGKMNRALGVGRGIATAPEMLNQAIAQAQRLALHDAMVVIISDFDGADPTTRSAVGALAQHNDVIAVLVHDPSQSELPAAARMTVTDGELQISIDSGRDIVRQNILAASKDRL